MALDYQRGFRLQSRPLAAAWPLLVTRTRDLNMAPRCSRAMVPDMAVVATQVQIFHDLRCHCSPLASACSPPLSCLQFCLSSQHVNCSACFSFFLQTFTHYSGTLPVLPGGGSGPLANVSTPDDRQAYSAYS